MNEKNNNIIKPLYVLPQDCDFMTIASNTATSSDCTPQLDDIYNSAFRGLLINGPQAITWPQTVVREHYYYLPNGSTNSPHRLLIAGLGIVLDSTLGLDGDAYDILLVAVNQHTAEAYSGTMRRLGSLSGRPQLPNIPDDNLARTAQVIFNIDLVHNLGIPIRDATYTVYATLGQYQSNIITIKTTVKQDIDDE